MKITKRIISLLLAGVISAGAASAVCAEDAAETAKAVVFTAGSGYVANSYTGVASGFAAGASAGDILMSLENKNGIAVKRGDSVLAESDVITGGDKIVLTADDGSVKAEFTLMIMGNADMNDKINLSDASAMLKKIAGWDVTIDDMAADVDGSGAVNLTDVASVLKSVAGWDVTFAKPVLPGKHSETIMKPDVPCYGKNPTMGWQPLCLSDGIHYDLGAKFVVKEGEIATKISFLCPSWADDKGRLTISLYKWTGDYNDSIAAMPIISQTFVDYKDNSTLIFGLADTSGKGIAEGEYVWRIHDGADAGDGTGVGIWYYPEYAPAEDTGIKTFLNCKEFNIGPVVNISMATAK